MITPSKIEYTVGKTINKQTVKLIRETNPFNVTSWTLQKLAADQRDDTVTIYGLDDDTILNMAQAVKNHTGR